MTRALVIGVVIVAAVWLAGAALQGILVELSLTTRKVWLFTWWLERFGFGVVIGFVAGLIVSWFVLRPRLR